MWRIKKGEYINMLKSFLLFLTNLATRAIPLALVAALAVEATAQNLVVNGSFEDTVNCEIPTQCTLLKASDWYNPTQSTPDLYDADTVRQCGYMIQSAGMVYMPPKQGLRMAGFYFWDGPFGGSEREYIATELSQPLTPGTNYEVGLWYVRNRAFQAAVDHVGIWLGYDSLFMPTFDRLNVIPQLKLRDPLSEYLTESHEWTQLVDTLTAQGGERWLVIGNFDSQDSLHGILAEPEALFSNCYYYIDNVMVRSLTGTSVPEIGMPSVNWNSGGLQVRWSGTRGPLQVDVFSAGGCLVHRANVPLEADQAELAMVPLAKGLYVLRFRCANKEAVVKFVKMEGE